MYVDMLTALSVQDQVRCEREAKMVMLPLVCTFLLKLKEYSVVFVILNIASNRFKRLG